MPKLAYTTKKFRTDTLLRIHQANEIIEEYAAQGYDLTLRQLYYQHVARGLVPNKQSEYDKLGSIINDARMAGLIDWNSIVDRGRFRRGRFQYHQTSPAGAVDSARKEYATDLWKTQPVYVEAWIEKDALVGVLESACWHEDVSYFSCRGYSSASEMWRASNRFIDALDNNKKVVILHLGDHDPSGIDMTRDIRDRIFTFLATDLYRFGRCSTGRIAVEEARDNFMVRRIALNMDQVDEYQPPPNPAKMTDSRVGDYIDMYGYESWELDALPPDVLTQLISDELNNLRDHDAWEAALAREAEEQRKLALVSERWDEVEELLAS